MEKEKSMLEKALINARENNDSFMIEIIQDYFKNFSQNPVYEFVYSGGKMKWI